MSSVSIDARVDFERTWEVIREEYPRRDGAKGWPLAEKRALAHCRKGEDIEKMLAGVLEYAELCQRTEILKSQFVKMPSTFFGPGKHWLDDFSGSKSATKNRSAHLDELAKEHGLNRAPGESDAHLERRVGIYLTNKKYGYV